jgi:GxxExxY protein
MLIEGALTARILEAFFGAYRSIGFGYSEKICRNTFALELQCLEIAFVREVPIDVMHRGVCVGAFRFDLVVEDRVLVEVKATQRLIDADRRQILSYLKTSGQEVGLLLNFGPIPEHERFVYTKSRK